MRNFFTLMCLILTFELINGYERKIYQTMLNDQTRNSFISALKFIDSNGKNQLINRSMVEMKNEKRMASNAKCQIEFKSVKVIENIDKIQDENNMSCIKSENGYSNACLPDSRREAYRDIFSSESIKKIGRTESGGTIQTHLPESNRAIYVERTENMNRLSSLINSEQFVWVHAEIGTGTSTLALKYAHEFASNRIIRWINSESLTKILEDLRTIARDIGEEPRLTIDYMIDCINHFIGQHGSINFLFIFDNLEALDQEMVFMFDKLRVNKNLKFVITTGSNLELYKTSIFTNQNRLTLANFNGSEQIEYGKMFIEKYYGDKFKQKEIEAFMSDDECMKSKISPYELNVLRMNLLAISSKEYFRALCNKSTELTTAYPLLAHIKNSNLNDEWNTLQYVAFLDSNFINIDILENVLNKTKSDLLVSIKSLELLDLVSFQMKYDTAGIRVFHKKFQQETLKFMKQCVSNCLDEKEIGLNLIRSLNQLIPNLAEMDSYFSLLEYGAHFRFKNLEKSYSAYINPAYVKKSEDFKKNVSIIESYLTNYYKVLGKAGQLTIDNITYVDVNLIIKKFWQIFCYHSEGMHIHNFFLMKFIIHFFDFENLKPFFTKYFMESISFKDGLWFLVCPYQFTWKLSSFFTFGFV